MSLELITAQGENALDRMFDDSKKKRFFKRFLEGGSRAYIENSNSESALIKHENALIPLTLSPNNVLRNQDYITSFIAQYLLYTKEEVLKGDKYSKGLKRGVKISVPVLQQFLSILKFNKIVWVNNQLTSTSLYEKYVDNINIGELVQLLQKKYDRHSIAFRGVCPATSPVLYDKLLDFGFIPLSGRQVYIFDPSDESYKKKRPFQMDKKLSEKQEKYEWCDLNPDSSEDVERVHDLFSTLYIGKHSKFNPMYTKEFIAEAHRSGYMTFEVLKEIETGVIEAVQGIFENDSIVTTPFIGYNLEKPKKDGLYRLMNYRLMEIAISTGKLLNMSSGADTFKKQRGGKPSFEYHMIYATHLPALRQYAWKQTRRILEQYVQPQMLESV